MSFGPHMQLELQLSVTLLVTCIISGVFYVYMYILCIERHKDMVY